jgi:hypothetical protein
MVYVPLPEMELLVTVKTGLPVQFDAVYPFTVMEPVGSSGDAAPPLSVALMVTAVAGGAGRHWIDTGRYCVSSSTDSTTARLFQSATDDRWLFYQSHVHVAGIPTFTTIDPEASWCPTVGVQDRSNLQYGGWRSVNIGKCRTLRVSKRDPLRMAVAAIARSALSIV